MMTTRASQPARDDIKGNTNGWAGSRARFLVLVAVLCLGGLLSGCNTNCRTLELALCDTCGGDMDDAYGDAYCKCIEDGAVTEGDFSEDEAAGRGIENDDDAEQWCDSISMRLSNKGSDGDASCKADLDYLNKWGSGVCEELR